MTNKEEAGGLSFGVSLCEQSVRHLDFLKTIDSVPELKNLNVLRRALFRYEKYWLPLAADHPGECLVAPLDVEWMWHCHLLNPKAYEVDCQCTVGATINHTLYSPTEALEKRQKSREYWLQKYNESEAPFNLDFSTDLYDQKEDESFKSKMSYDIVAAAQRQTTFYYQVSLPHYRDRKFLEACLLRYKQFLYMKTKVRQDFLAPCYDIDLIWHTHQLNPVAYKDDMVRIIGYLFNHDDTDSDRSNGSKLDNSGKQTSENWKTFYNEDFSKLGAMYRGKPPNGRLGMLSQDDAREFGTKTYTYKITIEKLTLTLPSGSSLRSYRKIILSGSCSKNGEAINEWFSLTRQTGSSSKTNTVVWTDVGSFELNTNSVDAISFGLHQWKGRACCASESEKAVGYGEVDIVSLLDKKDSADNKDRFRIESRLKLASDISVDIEGHYSIAGYDTANFIRKWTTLHLVQGCYETVVIPDDIQQLLGPVELERLPSGTNNLCKVAVHSLKNKDTNVVEITVKVIHSIALMTSVIQVFYHDKMVALANLISSDQLPLPTQVDKDVITLNPRQGERAVLIKNNHGDWAVVLGRWKGFKRGKAGTSCFRAEYGHPGSLSAKFYKFSTNTTTSITYPFYTFSLDSCKVDLRRIIAIDTSKNEVAENIAMAFSVALLHVLCIPRPKDWKEGEPIDPEVKIRGKKPITTVPSYDMAFIMAAGLLRNTPSNYYVNSHHGNPSAIYRRRVKDDGDWQDLPGEGENDAGCDGCACSGRDDSNKAEFDSGDLGAGCGGCGGHACASTCGGTGKGRCVSDYKYKGRSDFNTSSSASKGGAGVGSGDGTTGGFDAHFFVTVSNCAGDNDTGDSGVGGGGCGGGGD